jgi:hypothetical protein
MRRIWRIVGSVVVVMATAGAVRAQPSAPPPVPVAAPAFEVCLAKRREISGRLAASGPDARRHLIAAMPECVPTMAAFDPGSVDAAARVRPMRERAGFTIVTNPLTPVAGLVFRGIAGDLQVEGMIRPHVGVAVSGIGIYARALLSEDVMVTSVLGWADVRIYYERFAGGYVGAGPAFLYCSNSSGTGFLGGDVEADEGVSYGGTAFIGWKWMRDSGFTQTLQLGVIAVHGDFGTEVAPQLNWRIGGSFGGG